MRRKSPRSSSALFCVASLVCLGACHGCAKNQASGTAARNERRVTLSHSIGVWHAEQRTATIFFLSSAPTTEEREKLLKAPGRLNKGTPWVELALVFRPASVNAELATLAEYTVTLWDFEDDPAPLQRHAEQIGFGPLVDWTKQREVIEVSGALGQGARLKGRFEGESDVTIANKRAKRLWSLSFDVKLE